MDKSSRKIGADYELTLSLKEIEVTFPNNIFDGGETAAPTEKTYKKSEIIQRLQGIHGETYQQRLDNDVDQESSSWQKSVNSTPWSL